MAETGKDSSLMQGDPLNTASFGVEIEGKISGYFKELSGLETSNEVIELQEQDKQGKRIIRKIPGPLKWGDLVLKQGITSNMAFWKWRQEVVDGHVQQARKDGSVMMYDHAGKEIARWNFKAAWPSKVTGPTMNAGESAVGIEEITITHEGLERKS